MRSGVEIDQIRAPRSDVKGHAQKVLAAGGQFLACGACLKLRNSEGSELCPLSYVLPLTYGADVLHGAIHRPSHKPLALDFGLLAGFCALLFGVSLRNIRKKWIV